MCVAQIKIGNFRSVKYANPFLPEDVVFIGDDNTGKATIYEAFDWVLGPDRPKRQPVISEHGFFRGTYKRANTPKFESSKATPASHEKSNSKKQKE